MRPVLGHSGYVCGHFTPHYWKNDKCRTCFAAKSAHASVPESSGCEEEKREGESRKAGDGIKRTSSWVSFSTSAFESHPEYVARSAPVARNWGEEKRRREEERRLQQLREEESKRALEEEREKQASERKMLQLREKKLGKRERRLAAREIMLREEQREKRTGVRSGNNDTTFDGDDSGITQIIGEALLEGVKKAERERLDMERRFELQRKEQEWKEEGERIELAWAAKLEQIEAELRKLEESCVEGEQLAQKEQEWQLKEEEREEERERKELEWVKRKREWKQKKAEWKRRKLEWESRRKMVEQEEEMREERWRMRKAQWKGKKRRWLEKVSERRALGDREPEVPVLAKDDGGRDDSVSGNKNGKLVAVKKTVREERDTINRNENKQKERKASKNQKNEHRRSGSQPNEEEDVYHKEEEPRDKEDKLREDSSDDIKKRAYRSSPIDNPNRITHAANPEGKKHSAFKWLKKKANQQHSCPEGLVLDRERKNLNCRRADSDLIRPTNSMWNSDLIDSRPREETRPRAASSGDESASGSDGAGDDVDLIVPSPGRGRRKKDAAKKNSARRNQEKEAYYL